MNRDGGGIKDVLISYVDIHFRLPSIYAFYIYIYKTTRVKDTSISFIFAFFSPSIYAFYYLPNIQTYIYSSGQTTEGMNCFLLYTFRAERKYFI